MTDGVAGSRTNYKKRRLVQNAQGMSHALVRLPNLRKSVTVMGKL